METVEAVPKEFILGDTVKFLVNNGDYLPVDGWVLSMAFVNVDKLYTVTATDNGDGRHLFTITAATSLTYLQGAYDWQLYATKSPDRYTIDEGEITVRPNLTQHTSGIDTRSQARQTLDAIEATINKRATSDQLSYSVQGRSLSRIPMLELIALRDKYSELVRRENEGARLKKGLKTNSTIRVRF